jgi:hypothetical protein
MVVSWVRIASGNLMVRVALLWFLRGFGLFICILYVSGFYYKRILLELTSVVKKYLYVLQVFDGLVAKWAKWGQNGCLIFKQSWKLGKYPLVDIDLSEFLKKDPF